MDWKPKTLLGKEVFDGKIASLDEIFSSGRKIKESEIIDKLLPGLQNELIYIGGSAGKGGGKKRTPTKRTTRMHRSGRRYTISAMVVVGDGAGYFGVGKSESKEHRTAIEKALQNAKLNVIPLKIGCGSWECACGQKHSIPYQIEGKSSSVRVLLKPAPKGIGLAISDEGKKIMRLAGIRDVWAQSFGNTGSRVNYTMSIFNAFRRMNRVKMHAEEEPELAEPPKMRAEDIASEKPKPRRRPPMKRQTKKTDKRGR